MMVSEFIERVGFEPTAVEYEEIEAEYMGASIDKDQFCKEWKRNGGIQRLTRLRARRIEELEAEVARRGRQYDEMDAYYCRKINRIKEDMNSKLNEAVTACGQQKERLLQMDRLCQEANAAKEEAEQKLAAIRTAFEILGIGKEVK